MKKQFSQTARRRVVKFIHCIGLCGPDSVSSYSWIALDPTGEQIANGHGWLGTGESWTPNRANTLALLKALRWSEINHLRGLIYFTSPTTINSEVDEFLAQLAGRLSYIAKEENRAFPTAQATLDEIRKHSKGLPHPEESHTLVEQGVA